MLQDVFYIITIAFFVSVWVLMTVLLVGALIFAHRLKAWKKNFPVNQINKAGLVMSAIPVATTLLPWIKKSWQHWRASNSENID